MDVAVLTVGNEVLAGDIQNTNASWLAARLSEEGSPVVRMLTIPDERSTITETIRTWREPFDAIVVTGGLGGTPDDVTVEAIADAFDRSITIDPTVRQDVLETIAAYRNVDPARVDETDLSIDIDRWAAVPEDARPLLNPAGLCPGFVLENVYAFPGVPEEMRSLFELVAHDFAGEQRSRTVFTDRPESALVPAINRIRTRYDVAVGSYPNAEGDNRVKVTGCDADVVSAAAAELNELVGSDHEA